MAPYGRTNIATRGTCWTHEHPTTAHRFQHGLSATRSSLSRQRIEVWWNDLPQHAIHPHDRLAYISKPRPVEHDARCYHVCEARGSRCGVNIHHIDEPYPEREGDDLVRQFLALLGDS